MMVCLELHLILVLQMTALVGCTKGQATKSAKLVYERHSENFDYDDNYQITVTRGREIIDSTLTKDGHAREITVSISAFGSVFHLDLKLNTYLLAKNYVEKTINKDGVISHDVKHNERHCFYLGTVREQPLSKAALSTCQGIVGYFSIGNVSYHIEQRSGRLNGDHKVYRRRNDAEALIRKGHDQMSMASLLNKKKHSRRMRRSFEWPQDRDKENKVIEIYVANDRSQYLSQGSDSNAVFQQTKDIVNIANLGFQSLGIYLILVGSEVWADSDRINVNASNASATTQEWTTYRMASINPSTPNDHGVLITNNTFENTTIIGFAYISVMCSNRLSASLVSDVFKRPIVAAAVMDHGIGINLGITSDTAFGNCSCDDPSGYCIMNSSVNPALSSLTWSQCSKDQFHTLDTFGIDICLQNVPEYFNNLNASSTCGNGIVEHGEHCDCGNATDQECNKLCCDATTCLLQSWATCAYGRCCDISTCQVFGCNTTCRQMTSDCDLVEFCNGISGLCPSDTYRPDGTECVVNGASAYCYSGLCQSRESQCQLLWGSDTLVSSDQCYNSVNILGEYYGNCGINWLPNVTYVPCNSSDVFCGRLLCQDNNKTLHHNFNFFEVASAYIANDTCHSVIFDFGLETQDPGLVPNGAKCGVDKMCVNQRCVDVDTTSHCPSDCRPDEVCNNLGQCQKMTASCQNSTGPTAYNRVVNFCFVVDGSGSICNDDPSFNYATDYSCNDWNALRQLLHCVVAGYTYESITSAKVRIGLIIYNGLTPHYYSWDLIVYSDLLTMFDFIDNLPYQKGNSTESDIAGALTLMIDRFFNTTKYPLPTTNQAIIAIGENVINPSLIQQEINRAHSNNISTFLVGVGDQVDTNLLQQFGANDNLLNGVPYIVVENYHNLLLNPALQCTQLPSSSSSSPDIIPDLTTPFVTAPFDTTTTPTTSTITTTEPTTPFITTTTPTTPIITTTTPATTFVITTTPTTPIITTTKSTTPFATTTSPTTPIITTTTPTTAFVTTTTPTTPFIKTSKHTTPFITTTTPTTPVVTTTKPTTPFVITTTHKSPTSYMETSKPTTGAVSTLGAINREVSTSASKATSGEMPTAFDVRFVSTTLQTTTKQLYPCDTLPCVNGNCLTDNFTATCACIEGYRGRLCEEEIAECDSDPCLHDSKCVDGLNNYTCQCIGGYTGRNCETDVNECESNPCTINSTCEDSISRYQCICPYPNQLIGIQCNNISAALPGTSNFPAFVDASPNHGPISGGTKITIVGRNLDQYEGVAFIYIGNMKLPIKNWTSSWSKFSVVTTAGESSIVGRVQTLVFEITGGKNMSSTFTFTYYPDPEIEDVKPTEQLASGGTTLTIIGSNLNSSAAPHLQMIVNTTTSGRLNKNITTINGPACDASSSSEIYCLMPRVNAEGFTVLNHPGSDSRKRRDANSPNITTSLTLILKSDAAEASPNKSVLLTTYHGTLDPVTGPVSFNPDDDPFIHIKGLMLSDGIGADDYEVYVGGGVCTNITLTANELKCLPPTEEPDPGSNQTFFCSDPGGLLVTIFVGRKVDNASRIQLKWGCLIYSDPCDTLPCVNGTCIADNNTCACIAGYRGRLCEEEIAECDSDPCQHDSTCVDGLNNYTCQCLAGYNGRNCETDVNECDSNPCPINSTCEDSINRYQCICPDPNKFIGIQCDMPVPRSGTPDFPAFVDASPNHGPISGGTKFTIVGSSLKQYGGISFVYIGDIKLPIKNWTSSWSEFIVVTTAGNSSIVGQSQRLIFQITGGRNISSELAYTYYPDPEIDDIKPQEQLASGGTTLTVIGSNLNSSASPYLQVILNTTTPGRLNKNITTINGPSCDASSSTMIYCLMPRVNVVGTTVVKQPGSNPRKRRDANTQNITVILTLILKSDGAEDSPNKSVILKAYNGTLDRLTGPVFFNPNDDPFIYIKGKSLRNGIVTADDYQVYVGIGICTVTALTSNELSCRPPTEEPDPGSDPGSYCIQSGGLSVNVFAGQKVDNGSRIEMNWGCLVYAGWTFSWWIILIICGGCALLLVLTVICFVLCKRRSKLQREGSAHQVFSATGSNVDPAKSDWTKTKVDAQGKLMDRPRNMRNDTYASRITGDFRLNDYHEDPSVREFSPNDYNRTLGSDWSKSNINIDERGRQITQHELDMIVAERNGRDLRQPVSARGKMNIDKRGRQMTQYELDMIAAERNARDLQNPVSVRYSYGLLSGDESRDAEPHVSSNYINSKTGSEIYAMQDWRKQGRPFRPITQKPFGGDWKATDDDAISLAPALRANRHDFLGQNRGFRSPLYGSFELPTTSDSTGHLFGQRGQ